jgi:hypothetical protein
MELVSSVFMPQMLPLPEEGKKTKTYKTGGEEYKKAVDDSFKKLGTFFEESERLKRISLPKMA